MRRAVAERREFVQRRSAEMAASPTQAEERMWEILEPLGFFRQWPIYGSTKNGGSWIYILDFVHCEYRLCVEVDGGVHRKRKGRDRRRDARLAGEGIRTIRLTNYQVLHYPFAAEAKVTQAMAEAHCEQR